MRALATAIGESRRSDRCAEHQSCDNEASEFFHGDFRCSVRAAQQGQTGLALVGAGGVIIAVIAVTAGSGGGKNAAQPNAQSVVGTTS